MSWIQEIEQARNEKATGETSSLEQAKKEKVTRIKTMVPEIVDEIHRATALWNSLGLDQILTNLSNSSLFTNSWVEEGHVYEFDSAGSSEEFRPVKDNSKTIEGFLVEELFKHEQIRFTKLKRSLVDRTSWEVQNSDGFTHTAYANGPCFTLSITTKELLVGNFSLGQLADFTNQTNVEQKLKEYFLAQINPEQPKVINPAPVSAANARNQRRY